MLNQVFSQDPTSQTGPVSAEYSSSKNVCYPQRHSSKLQTLKANLKLREIQWQTRAWLPEPGYQPPECDCYLSSASWHQLTVLDGETGRGIGAPEILVQRLRVHAKASLVCRMWLLFWLHFPSLDCKLSWPSRRHCLSNVLSNPCLFLCSSFTLHL